MILHTKKKGLLTIFGILFGLGTFTIFGLTMSVGLIVHHKINAQNSVDIGAIYAAQKQAETLSVLSHLNYQLWQNYKLFSYRYNFLGNVGAYRKGGASGQIDIRSSSSDDMFCPNTGKSRCSFAGQPRECSGDTIEKDVNNNGCPFAFCVWHPYFYIDGRKATDTANPCQNLHEPLDLPKVSSGGIGIGYRLAQRKVKQLSDQIRESCKAMGLVNWLMASASYLSFYDEQRKRKEFIKKYFNTIIKGGLDLDGKPIKDGVENTIVKNLTLPIYQSEKFIYAKRSSDGKNFDDYFDWVDVEPANLNLNYVQNIKSSDPTKTCGREVMSIFDICDLDCGQHLDIDSCESIQSYPYKSFADAYGEETRCKELQKARDEKQVIGFTIKKDPNKTNFYSQVFMHVNFHGGIFFPFRNPIPMVAQALSKPFGASFGEPNIKTWENYDSPPFPTYPLSADSTAQYRYGLLAAKRQVILHDLMNEFIKFNPRGFPPNPPKPVDVKEAGFDLLSYMNLKVTGSAGMVLPWIEDGSTGNYEVDSSKILNFPARIMEEIAISPDEYDETNFSILTNYMLSAYIRLKESGVKFPTSINPIGDYIPPDIGHYDGREFLEKIINGTVTRGISASNTVLKQDYINHLNNFNLKVGSFEPSFFLNYIERQINLAKWHWKISESKKLEDIDYTLTSWVPRMKGDIFTSFAKFRDISSQQRGSLGRDCSSIDPPVQCCFLKITDDFKMDSLKIRSQGNYNHLYWERNKRKHIPHFTHCVSGGRSGFSVKIIHPSTVNEDLLSSERGQHSP